MVRSWALYDDSFCASDLMEVLNSIPKLQHYFKMRIYLNYCYGLAFTKEVASIQSLVAVFQANFKEDIEGSRKFPIKLKNWSIDDIIEYASKNNISDDDHRELNECITDQMIKMWENARDFIKLNVKFSGYILPFAFGPLDAKGVLLELTNKTNKYQNYDPIKIVRALPRQLDDRLDGEGICYEPADPQLIVFPAGHGDTGPVEALRPLRPQP